jgi:hypothetical protein
MPEKARRKRPSTDRHTHERGFSCRRRKVQLKRETKHTNLLLLPERSKTDTGDLDDLEADTGDITLGLAATTEAGDEHLVVLVDEVEATVVLQGAAMSIRNGSRGQVGRRDVRGRRR